jgi:DNA-binding PadR family transcriptional regulator
MRKDDLKRAIARTLSTREMHGYEIQKELVTEEVRPNLSYLYRVLAEMEREGYIKGSLLKSALGPRKRVYRLGKKGLSELDQVLKEAVNIVHAKYLEYLTKLPPEKSAIKRLQLLLDKNSAGNRILVVAPRVYYDWMISPLCDKFKQGKIYLIKQQSCATNLKLENLTILDSSVENILLRDNFVEDIRVHGDPGDTSRALKEIHRVLTKDGTLAFIVPYVHSRGDGSPLTLGEFVEKVEHDVSGEKSNLEYTVAMSLLSRYFRNVKHYRLAHLIVFVAKGKR